MAKQVISVVKPTCKALATRLAPPFRIWISNLATVRKKLHVVSWLWMIHFYMLFQVFVAGEAHVRH